jgi:hypothetical protein
MVLLVWNSCTLLFYENPAYTHPMDSQAPGAFSGEFIFTFANTRDAVEGEKTLLAGGISPGVMPLPEQIGAGCGICLRVSPAELEKARSILNAGFQGIYAAETAGASGKKDFTLWNP